MTMAPTPSRPALAAVATLFLGWGTALADSPRPLERLTAPEARQAVAVDATAVYAIDNHAIGRYDKTTGRRLAGWNGGADGPIRHLNSGVVIDGRLYCAHSNYPAVPMASSIEIWDARSLEHVGSHSFGIDTGSATWIDDHDGAWWVMFAHYAGRGGVPGKGPEWSTLVRFDREWRRTGGWLLPRRLVDALAPYSNSGGAWGDDGLLYLSGHNGGAVYVMALPEAGFELELVATVEAPIDGQGIAWDAGRRLYGIDRSRREIRSTVVPAVAAETPRD